MLISPQLLTWIGIGEMMSVSEALAAADVRLFAQALPNALHSPAGKTPAAVRSMAASPNVFVARVAAGDWSGSITVPRLFVAPIAIVPLKVCELPQHGGAAPRLHWMAGPVVTQVSKASVGAPLPLKL